MLKRAFDIIVSFVGLILLSPFFIIISVLIYYETKGRIFFFQKRVGKKGKIFKLIKFRTMRPDAEWYGKITIGVKDPRITPMGALLRKYKLDELPQLINVLFGSMSMVGPRPEVPEYVEMYDEIQRNVLNVKPGITDYASIVFFDENDLLGKSDKPIELYVKKIMPAKLTLNLKYIEEQSFKKDVGIIVKTIRKIVGK